ncbi:30S ribosomal protein S2 [Candidatus Nomurabacteria bacterium]|nr:30S ribosomal protein S2 [Candidatus Nomurabacteria bacterium]
MIKELFAVGAHFGYSKSRSHPSMRSFIYGFKNQQAVIDLEQTVGQLERASAFIRGLAMEGKEILLVGNKIEAMNIVRQAAESLDVPYVASRWLGGTFTNWPQIKSRIDRMHELKDKRDKGELSVYTKKEQLLFSREISRLERYLLSLSNMTKLPAAVVVIDPMQEAIVVSEAGKVKVPVVALAGSDCNLAGVNYPVVANDSNVKSIQFFVDKMVEAYRAGQSDAREAKVTA